MGRTVDITQDLQLPVTKVQFTDVDGDVMSIIYSHREYIQLSRNNSEEFVVSRKDIDNMIKLFQAAKVYKI